MSSRTSFIGGLATAATVAAAAVLVTAATPPTTQDRVSMDRARVTTAPDWKIEATGARIIGGYGDNFAYSGDNVRPLDGSATMTVDPEAGTANLEIRIRTTEASGPIRFSADRSFEGDIRIVQKLDTSEMGKARIATDVFLHGDTGNEAPVMPKLYNYFATWGPGKIWVDGEEVVSMIGSHTMFSEQARGPNGKIVNASGQTYSPMVEDKTGFTNPEETEFHFVAHTTEPDQDNFPPHTAWIHLHFSDVEVVQKPAEQGVPYERS